MINAVILISVLLLFTGLGFVAGVLFQRKKVKEMQAATREICRDWRSLSVILCKCLYSLDDGDRSYLEQLLNTIELKLCQDYEFAKQNE